MFDPYLLTASLSLGAWIYLATAHSKFWQPLIDATEEKAPAQWPSVDIIVPARNEAESLPQSLPSLLAQKYEGNWRIILVDDHSKDGTTDVARKLALDAQKTDKLLIVQAPELPAGWAGKVAAMKAGVDQSQSAYILFTDADIEHPADSLKHLVATSLAQELDLYSQMVKLHCQTQAEKLLIPAFIFFFSLLYPFRRANNVLSRLAAAAGGVMLIKQKALKNIGGLARIKNALIDDCSLAHAVKNDGGDDNTPGKIRLAHTHNVHSLRVYPDFKSINDMIARTAFTQLRYSPWLLLGTLLGLSLLFLAPIASIVCGTTESIYVGLATWFLMTALYVPTILFYGLPLVCAASLPAAAACYMYATFDSAKRYWQGQGGHWKDRAQASL